MSNSNLVLYAAYGTAVMWVLALIFLALEFTVSATFGTLSNGANALALLLFLPLVLLLSGLYRPASPVVSTGALIIAIIGLAAAFFTHVQLVIGAVRFQDVILRLYAGYALIGIWFVALAFMNIKTPLLSKGLGWTSVITGAGFLFFFVSMLIMGTEAFVMEPGSSTSTTGGPMLWLGYLGGLAYTFGYSVWAIWLGRSLQTSVLVAATG